LRQLEWGSGWLEALALRRSAAGSPSVVRELSVVGQPSAVCDRLQGLLDLVAGAQEHDRFADAATAFVTELATRLDCDRVSIGFVSRGRARVRALSHTAHLGGRTNLLRGIGAAMDEAIDQQESVVVPPMAGATPVVCRAHDDLARHGAGGGVCTVPFSSGRRIVGGLTFELPEGRPFDAGTLELVEAVAGLVGPGLEMRRREDRWLAVKMMDAAAHALGRLLGRGHLVLKLGTLTVIAAAALLFFATGDYRVAARAVMEAG